MMEEGGRGHDLDIYLAVRARRAMALAHGRLQSLGSTSIGSVYRNRNRSCLKAPENW